MNFFDTLTDSQKQAVCHMQGPLLVLAGPGSGKTRVITGRIAHLIENGVKPYNICAITFTNRAAEEMKNRVSAMGVPSGVHLSTFHSLCVRLLRQYARAVGISSNFSIYDDKDQKKCIKDAIKTADLSTSNFPPAKIQNAISNLKNELQSPQEFADRADEFFSKSLAKIYANYQKMLTDNNALDFDDLLFKVAYLIRDNRDIRIELSSRFQYLLVDEYQDTNHAQYQIARGLAMEHHNICVTGDPDQSIYRWRGADIRNIMSFEQDWPDAKTIKLQENFRSTEKILKVADRLISHNSNRKDKILIATIKGGQDIVVTEYEDETDEAYGLARNIKLLIDAGADPKQIAVFYRVNSMSRTLEESLVQNQIPYQIVRGVEFYGRKEIRDMLAYLKVLVNPDDDVALTRIVNTPIRGIGKTTIEKINRYALTNNISMYKALKKVELIDTINRGAKGKISKFVNMIELFKASLDAPVAVIMDMIFSESGLSRAIEDDKNASESAIDNVGELINSAENYDQQADDANLTDYLQSIALYSDTDAYDSNTAKVSLMTLHAAKGLEFNNVFIIGLEDGILPHERSALSTDEMEEERRLFFVGITRARKGLSLSFTNYRTVRGQFLRTVTSPFLAEAGLIDTASKDQECADGYQYDTSTSQVQDYNRTSTVRKAKAKSPAYVTGQIVRHKKFGTGRVAQFIEMGDNSIVVVKFAQGHTRSLMLKYAKLEILS